MAEWVSIQKNAQRGGVMKKGTVVFLLVVGGFIFLVVKGQQSIDEKNKIITTSNDPPEIITAIIDKTNAKPVTSITNQKMTITIDDVSSLGANNKDEIWEFNYDCEKIVPLIFAKFAYVDRIDMIGKAVLVDIRGNKTTDVVLRVPFTRANSAKIQWNNIKVENINLLADEYYVHPVMLKD